MSRRWIVIASLLLAVSVIAGAFGAHGLRGTLSEYSMAVYEKAVFYHMVHALGLLIIATMPSLHTAAPHREPVLVCVLLTAGIFLFSGSLYALALTDVKMLGMITPLGGTAFIAAWIALAWSAFRQR